MLKIMFMLLSLLLLTTLQFSTFNTWMALFCGMILVLLITMLKLLPYLSLFPIMASNMLFLDNLSMPLVILTMWTAVMMLMASFPILLKNQYAKLFGMNLVLLTLTLITMFLMNNFMLFYVFFEASLIPTLLMILGWGYQPERLQAGIYLILYTVLASLPLLISLLIIYSSNSSLFMLNNFYVAPTNTLFSMWWFISIMAFMVKMPMYSTHLWLPKAHVEAPVAGSMILAGILLKLGGYGLLRMASPYWWVPTLSKLSPLFMVISVVGAIITAAICIRQTDLKALIAYSSVGHMALIIAGFMTGASWGWEASLIMMIAHGLCSSALFAAANMLYETTQSRSILLNKGMLSMFPVMTLWWFILASANMGAPPSLNLISEISLLTSIMSMSQSFMAFMLMSMFLAGAYSLTMYISTQHGTAPMYMNVTKLFNSRNHTILIMHSIPLFMLMLKTDLVLSWTL